MARGLSSTWELVYSDPHDGSNDRIFYASNLIVDGNSMRCKPDVVFRDAKSGQIVILERKVTGWKDVNIPQDAWPNVRAQLWCYGWIDEWVEASDVVLVCQFWRRRFGDGCQDGRNPWILNYEVHPAWRRSDNDFNSECFSYFSNYGGQFKK